MPIFTSKENYIKSQIEDVVTDMKNINCSSCNECCSIDTTVTLKEYKDLYKYLRHDKQGKLIFHGAVRRIVKMKEKGITSIMCPFSLPSKRCAIYNKRPAICRDFHCDTELHSKFNKHDYFFSDNKTIRALFVKQKEQ